MLFNAKTLDLKMKLKGETNPLQKRFMSYMKKHCYNGRLKLSHMQAGINTAVALKEVLFLDTANLIVHLDLSNNCLGDKGSRILCKAVKASNSLVTLNLTSNCIGAPAMANLFNELKQNYTLTDLNVCTENGVNDNCITNEAVGALSNFLSENKTISILDLSCTLLHDTGLKVILKNLGKINKE